MVSEQKGYISVRLKILRPLMIDPQGQAKRWIKANRGKALIVMRANNTNLLRTLESAVRNGSPVLIEDIDETLESSLDPILNKVLLFMARFSLTFQYVGNVFSRWEHNDQAWRVCNRLR